MKQTGILLAISSLPSSWGIGDLGSQAYQWLDMLHENGINLWQILPMNPLGYGNSPYQPYSSFAGDEIYLSLERLQQEGLLENLPTPCENLQQRVNYDEVRHKKETWLRKAFEAFVPDADYEEFCSRDWLWPYCAFRAFKQANSGVCWTEWNETYKQWRVGSAYPTPEIEKEAHYHAFVQYQFWKQWRDVLNYAHEKQISIMGDVPFYVGLDSADVWAQQEAFLLDEKGYPQFVAGVPPDYFSATGQRWGNPVYDWDYLQKTGFEFWKKRIGYCASMMDMVRIDHFRAFDTYWKIPASCPTAIEGEWLEAPGYEVLDTLFESIPGLHLVAEDLGDLRPQVLTLRDHYHLKGMKVFEFVFDFNGRYAKDTGEVKENQILYTGTHDNATLKEWYDSLTTAQKRKLRRWLSQKGFANGDVCERILHTVLADRANVVILPLQDVMKLPGQARMNVPGTVGSPNWEWRMTEMQTAQKSLRALKRYIKKRGRL